MPSRIMGLHPDTKPRFVTWVNKSSTATSEQTIISGSTYTRFAVCAIMVSNGGSVEHELSIYRGTGNDSDASKRIHLYVPPLGGCVFFNMKSCEWEIDGSQGLYFKRLSSGTDEIAVNVGYIDLT